MGSKWGSKKNGVRLGIEWSGPGAATSATTQMRITDAKIRIDRDVNITDSANNLSWSGGAVNDGSDSNINVSGSGAKTIKSVTGQLVTLAFGDTTTVSFSASMSGVDYAGGTISVSASITFPARPFLLPDAPTGLAATRVSDAQHNLAWVSLATTASAGKPYSAVLVERQTDSESAPWVQIASLGGSATAFTDATTELNRRYRWRIRAQNASGFSGYSEPTGWVYTTPAAPVVGVPSKSGSAITAPWVNASIFASQVEVWHAANGTWDGAALAVVGGAETSYIHSGANPSQTHAYRMRAKVSSGGTSPVTLHSAYSATSETVQLLAPPAPPTLTLQPVLLDAALSDVTVHIQHNPVDSTTQTAAGVRWRKSGAVDWNTAALATQAAYVIERTTLVNNASYEVQARTKGDYADFGAWSASVIFTTSATPQAGAVRPVDGAIVESSELTVEWTYFDPDGTNQTGWRVWLLSLDGKALGQANGTSADARTYTFPVALANLTGYRWQVQVRDGSGLWSEVSEAAFESDFPPPPAPVINLSWDDARGAVLIQITNPGPSDEEAEAVYNRIWRGDVMIADHVPIPEAPPDPDEEDETSTDPVIVVADPIPPLAAEVQYSVEAISEIPTSSKASAAITTPAGRWIYLNGGPGFATMARLRLNPAIDITAGREKVLRTYAGRKAPVEYVGPARSQVLRLGGGVDGTSARPDVGDWHAWVAVADLPAPICYRDMLGRRIFASIASDVGIAHNTGPHASISATLTEVDYAE